MKVSIIIATHNRASLLPRAIESALRAGGDLEVVVVDDASSDGTAEVCRRYQEVRFVRLERNVGLAGARNAGIRACSGEAIALLDDDDLRLPDSLPEQVAALEAEPTAAFVYGQVFVGDENCVPCGPAYPVECRSGDLFWALVKHNFVLVNSVVVRREPLFAVGLFDATLRRVEDWDLWIRLSEHWPVAVVPKPVAIYRGFKRDSGQLSSDRARMCQMTAHVQARGLALPRAMAAPAERREELRRWLLNILWRDLLSDTIRALVEGARSDAKANLHTAFRSRPRKSIRSEVFRCLFKAAWLPRRASLRERKTTPVGPALDEATASRLLEQLDATFEHTH